MRTSELIILELLREGFFSIDNQGHVWRHVAISRTGRRRTIDPVRADKVRADGYSIVRVCMAGCEHYMMAHRLVWASLHGHIPSDMEINHRDGQRSHNHPTNLELVTPGENLTHAYRVLGRFRAAGERNGKHKLTADQVTQIHVRLRNGESKRGLARAFGVSHVAIRKIATGQNWRDEFPRSEVPA